MNATAIIFFGRKHNKDKISINTDQDTKLVKANEILRYQIRVNEHFKINKKEVVRDSNKLKRNGVFKI